MHPARAHDLEPWCELVRSEFGELPTLRLTPPQARRLWSFDQETCDEVLARLVTRRFLIVAADGQYCRADCLDGAASMD
jgi:hypothetical protein